MKKWIVFFMSIFIVLGSVKAQETKTYYLSTNVLAPLSGINKSSATANALLPIFSNLEYGFTLSGGFLNKNSFTEARLTLGKSNSYNFIPQIQANYNFFLADYFKQNQSGWYIGANLRYWDYINTYTDSQRHNLAPGLNIGYLWKNRSWMYDLRLTQDFAVYTHTNIEGSTDAFNFSTSPMPNLSPILPFFSLNIGYKFEKK